MELSVPSNWTDELLKGLVGFPVKELYGALSHTPSGTGRASKIVPKPSSDQAVGHIKRARDLGFGFNYLLNGSCLGNQENDPSFREALFNHIEWAIKSGITGVTVANLFVLEFITSYFPTLPVKTSIFMAPINIPTMRKLNRIGADAVTLPQGYNRDFGYLKRIRESVDGAVWLIANVACAYDCPSLVYHATASGHDSQDVKSGASGPNTYPILRCTVNKLTDAAGLVRARWIRPDDIPVYEALGYSRFKIAGRDADTSWILRGVNAYAERRFEGNLVDILDGFHYLKDWQRRAGNISFRMPTLDNRSLDGFLEHFIDGGCVDLCDDCGYCSRIADESVNLYLDENRMLIDVINAYTETKRVF